MLRRGYEIPDVELGLLTNNFDIYTAYKADPTNLEKRQALIYDFEDQEYTIFEGNYNRYMSNVTEFEQYFSMDYRRQRGNHTQVTRVEFIFTTVQKFINLQMEVIVASAVRDGIASLFVCLPKDSKDPFDGVRNLLNNPLSGLKVELSDLMMFDPVSHQLQSYWELANEDDIKEIKRGQYGDSRLPIIERGDPFVKTLELPRDQVIIFTTSNPYNVIQHFDHYYRKIQ
jgi:hypothetical protein